MTLTVAIGELTRVLPWSFRALGYPFGTADRGARLVATAAALDPAVLDRIAEAGQRPEEGLRVFRKPNGLKVEANRCSLFETGAVSMDYLAAQASEADAVFAEVIDATETEVLPAVLVTGAEYGLTAVAFWAGSNGAGWMVAAPSPNGTRLHEGSDLEALVNGVGHAGLADCIRQADMADGLVLVATEQPVNVAFGTPGADVSEAVAAANFGGIPVSDKTLKTLYALEMITWAPTSERSRAQAGFTPKPAVTS
ncbi:hypothetical protein [Roseovarius salis]|uniref:hypothetical protein n=1 Tax=Roseovarius salis TaxID=3376063 RepID=UPI0037C61A10